MRLPGEPLEEGVEVRLTAIESLAVVMTANRSRQSGRVIDAGQANSRLRAVSHWVVGAVEEIENGQGPAARRCRRSAFSMTASAAIRALRSTKSFKTCSFKGSGSHKPRWQVESASGIGLYLPRRLWA